RRLADLDRRRPPDPLPRRGDPRQPGDHPQALIRGPSPAPPGGPPGDRPPLARRAWPDVRAAAGSVVLRTRSGLFVRTGAALRAPAALFRRRRLHRRRGPPYVLRGA